MKLSLSAAVFGFALAAPGLVWANEAPKLSAVIAELEGRGYIVTDVDVKRQHIEIEALNAQNVEFEIEVESATGKILREEQDR